jgi:primosomal protein N' (replication factor Y)
MSDRVEVADIGFDARTAGAEAVYTYRADADAAVGQIRLVPLGPRQALGCVLSVRTVTEDELGFPFSRLKPAGDLVHGLDLPLQTVALVQDVARQCLVPPSVALGLALPPGIKDRLVTEWSAVREPMDSEPLTTAQQEVLRVAREGLLVESKSKPVAAGARKSLLLLRRKGMVEPNVTLMPFSDRHRLSGMLRLTADSARVEKFLAREGRKRPAQAVTLMRLQGSEAASFSVQEIKALGGVTDQTVKALLQSGLLEQADEAAPVLTAPPVPNLFQQNAIDAICESLRSGKPDTFLLYGVTGSGKTEVFLRAAAEALTWGRQVLYLVPEIALTAQVIAQLRARFGRSVAVLHSGMSPGERLESWMRVRSGEAPVVLGPRSALFAPFTHLGLIIMDEEHESSYKQENAPRYHAKQAALFLAKQFSCPLVLGSATPSIESFYEAETGAITRLDLPERAASAQLPIVHIEDLKEGYKAKRPSIFSPRLEEAIRGALGAKKQVILFLNRRAYAPFLVCRECGHRPQCPNCSVSLSFHRKELRLRCHHCDYSERVPETCPRCGSEKVASFGVGAEKVEEEVSRVFEGCRVARLDRDISRKKGALEQILAQFRSGETDVLVGTQMVAKGLDFPNVTVVGVIAADISLNIPDFRASERTFQLLSQVAGRAGRGIHPGEVVIQTLSPDHVAVQLAKEHDYLGFYRALIEERREAHYPPFRRLVNVLITGEKRESVVGVAALAAGRISRAIPSCEVLGPADCPLERVQNMWRRHILVKLEPWGDAGPIADAIGELEDRGTRILIDVDPYSLL